MGITSQLIVVHREADQSSSFTVPETNNIETGQLLQVFVEIYDADGNAVHDLPVIGIDRIVLQKTGDGIDANYDMINEGAGEYSTEFTTESDSVGIITLNAKRLGGANISPFENVSVNSSVDIGQSIVTANVTSIKRRESFIGKIILIGTDGNPTNAKDGVIPLLLFEGEIYPTNWNGIIGEYEATIYVDLVKYIGGDIFHFQDHSPFTSSLRANYDYLPQEDANIVDAHNITINQADPITIGISSLEDIGETKISGEFGRPYNIYFSNHNQDEIVIANNIDLFEVTQPDFDDFAITLGLGIAGDDDLQNAPFDWVEGNYKFFSETIVIRWGDNSQNFYADDFTPSITPILHHFYDKQGEYLVEIDHAEWSLFIRIKVRSFAGSKVFNFNGSNGYLNFGNILNKNTTSPFSVVALIKSTNNTGERPIINKYSNSTGKGWIFRLVNGKLSFFYRRTNNGTYLYKTADIAVPLNTWVFVVMTKSASTSAVGVSFYINGSLISSTAIKNNLSGTLSTTYNCFMGRRSGYFKGGIDDLQVYNKVLSSAEILALWNDGNIQNPLLLPTSSNLEFYPRAEISASGTNGVADDSGNALNGTMTGGVTIIDKQ